MPQPRTSISRGNLISSRGAASGLSKLSLTSRKRIGRIRGRVTHQFTILPAPALGYNPDIFGHPTKTFIGTEVMMPK